MLWEQLFEKHYLKPFESKLWQFPPASHPLSTVGSLQNALTNGSIPAQMLYSVTGPWLSSKNSESFKLASLLQEGWIQWCITVFILVCVCVCVCVCTHALTDEMENWLLRLVFLELLLGKEDKEMDGWLVDGWMDGWINGWMGERMDGWKKGWMDRGRQAGKLLLQRNLLSQVF